MFVFKNSGSSAVIVSKVDLAELHGLRVLGSVFVPRPSGAAIGVARGWPPRSYRTWPEHTPATGSRILPGHQRELLFGPEPVQGGYDRSDGVDVFYTSGGADYHLRTGTRLAMVVTWPGHQC